MPGAGFWAIGASDIVFGRDGRWYADGEAIANPRIALLFSRHLVCRPDGTYAVVLGDETAAVAIEDTPWVVTGIDGDPARGFVLALNDATREPLDPATLEIGAGNVLYCRVKGGRGRARFLRPAYYAFVRHVEPAGGRGRFAVIIGGRRYPLRPADARPRARRERRPARPAPSGRAGR
jgi:hypothetical protein